MKNSYNFLRNYGIFFLPGKRAKKTTYFFIPFSKVSRTSVEASLIYVLVDVPLIPDASLKLDRRDCSGTDKCATRKEATSYQEYKGK